ncbi:protein PTHB1 [Eurytemora carolleeae]|uniref:protein PTHB1 n=1 Tax=Eurytemora carolleeae TaxID=1294199 RepID=UPI000C76C5FF|nr:protein PTHB1 [Eurytemora carolleeae]|eukprot:XP_023334274.1 protein PTHB1-like [Eurytemora affinis]
MSLFKAREWWSAGRREETSSSLSVGTLTGGEQGNQQIIVGSLTGLLQVYQPTARQDQGYSVEDLMLEQRLGAPILQLKCGTFMSGSQSGGSQQLAVLHPRQLSVFYLSRNQGTDAQGDSYALTLVYQHILTRSSYSFVTGSFGGGQTREYIAVLSLDGAISIFEQDSHSFTR